MEISNQTKIRGKACATGALGRVGTAAQCCRVETRGLESAVVLDPQHSPWLDLHIRRVCPALLPPSQPPSRLIRAGASVYMYAPGVSSIEQSLPSRPQQDVSECAHARSFRADCVGWLHSRTPEWRDSLCSCCCPALAVWTALCANQSRVAIFARLVHRHSWERRQALHLCGGIDPVSERP